MAIGAIGVAVYSIIAAPVTGGTSTVVAGLTASTAVSTLGLGTTTTAILIAVGAGGVEVLNSLRQYKEISRTPSSLILKRK